MAERLIFKTGLFHDDLKVWQATPDDTTRTWSSFQKFFCQAHRRYHRQKDTAQQAGYHAANAVFCMEMTKHIANLTLENRIKDKIHKNLNNQLLNMRKEMEEMQKKIGHPQQQHNAPNSKNGTNTNMARGELVMSRMMKMPARPDNGNYCWTHGYIVGDDYTSCTCNKKKPDHIDDATQQNPQGGSTRGKKERGLLWCGAFIMKVEENNNLNNNKSSLVADTAATANYIMINTPCTNIHPTKHQSKSF
jgi:hypothetical protein